MFDLFALNCLAVCNFLFCTSACCLVWLLVRHGWFVYVFVRLVVLLSVVVLVVAVVVVVVVVLVVVVVAGSCV